MAKFSHVAGRRVDGQKREDRCDGLNDYEIAKLWGVSHSRVFQLRQKALKKIRAAVLADPELMEVVVELCGLEKRNL